MKRVRRYPLWLTVMAACFLVASFSPAYGKSEKKKAKQEKELQELIKKSADAVEDFKKADESLSKFFDSACAYAVFPNVGKAGFWIGGASGGGVVYKGGEVIGRVKLSQLTVGPQIGGKRYAELVFFETQEALDELKKNDLEFSAQVSAVAAGEGQALNQGYKNGMAVFTLPIKGVMAEVSAGGQKFNFTPLGEEEPDQPAVKKSEDKPEDKKK